jgi:hypothetical protein
MPIPLSTSGSRTLAAVDLGSWSLVMAEGSLQRDASGRGRVGVLAVSSAPSSERLSKIDFRWLISTGFIGLGLINVWRMGFSSDVTFLQAALPTLLCGSFMVMFFLPLSGLVIASVDHDGQANAAGLSNFMRAPKLAVLPRASELPGYVTAILLANTWLAAV